MSQPAAVGKGICAVACGERLAALLGERGAQRPRWLVRAHPRPSTSPRRPHPRLPPTCSPFSVWSVFSVDSSHAGSAFRSPFSVCSVCSVVSFSHAVLSEGAQLRPFLGLQPVVRHLVSCAEDVLK